MALKRYVHLAGSEHPMKEAIKLHYGRCRIQCSVLSLELEGPWKYADYYFSWYMPISTVSLCVNCTYVTASCFRAPPISSVQWMNESSQLGSGSVQTVLVHNKCLT